MKSVEVRLERLTKHYSGQVVAVDDVSLTVKAGEILALLGPSGCGKTTCLRMIAGLVDPTSGEIVVGGKPTTRTPVHRCNVGMLFQNYALFPHMTVAENVAFGLEMRGISKADREGRVKQALDLVQLHCPPSAVIDADATYDALDALVTDGSIAAYGVSVET